MEANLNFFPRANFLKWFLHFQWMVSMLKRCFTCRYVSIVKYKLKKKEKKHLPWLPQHIQASSWAVHKQYKAQAKVSCDRMDHKLFAHLKSQVIQMIKNVPMLHIAAKRFHASINCPNDERGLHLRIRVSLQGLYNINHICISAKRKQQRDVFSYFSWVTSQRPIKVNDRVLRNCLSYKSARGKYQTLKYICTENKHR